MTVAVLVVLKRDIVTPVTGEPAYIAIDTKVLRFDDSTPLADALAVSSTQYPDALSFEIYIPRSDSAVQTRY